MFGAPHRSCRVAEPGPLADAGLAEPAHREQLAQVGCGRDVLGRRHVARRAEEAAQRRGVGSAVVLRLPLVGLVEQLDRRAVDAVDQVGVDPVSGDDEESRLAADRVDRQTPTAWRSSGSPDRAAAQIDHRDVLVGARVERLGHAALPRLRRALRALQHRNRDANVSDVRFHGAQTSWSGGGMEVDEFGQDTAVGDGPAAGASSWTLGASHDLFELCDAIRCGSRERARASPTRPSWPGRMSLRLAALVVRGRNSRTPSASGIPFDRRVA